MFGDVTVTNTGTLIGTPMYMSPEQVTGRIEIDHRTDIYSLGLVLYELLILRRPIVAPTREGVLRQVVTKALPPISWRNQAVPRALEGVIHKATAKDPDERYQAASAFAHDLQHWLGGRQVGAGPYRYRLDESEIAAERPTAVVVASGVMFLVAIAMMATAIGPLFYSLRVDLVGGRPRLPTSPERDLVIVAAIGVAGGLLMARVGSGLLGGRKWAVWSSTLAWVGVAMMLARFVLMSSEFSGESVAILLSLMLGVSWIFATLYLPRTRDWFRRASRLRSEHRSRASP